MQGLFALQIATEIALGIIERLKPHCEKIHVAGSIRRQKPEVKDIEIVCEPKQTIIKDLFGGDEGSVVSLEFTKSINQLGITTKGNTEGRYMQMLLPEGIKLDLFMPETTDYYRQYAIRTGSADYSHQVLAKGWLKKGWVGTARGLRKMEDCQNISKEVGKSKWKILNQNGEKPPVWQSEQEFFAWLGIKWIFPQHR